MDRFVVKAGAKPYSLLVLEREAVSAATKTLVARDELMLHSGGRAFEGDVYAFAKKDLRDCSSKGLL